VTNPELSFGLLTGDTAPDAIAALEAQGFDTLLAGGHVASRNPSPEVIVQLARLAACTERVRIGTSVLVLALYPPAVVAKQIADLDRVTGGRASTHPSATSAPSGRCTPTPSGWGAISRSSRGWRSCS
jgi:alkanesulfonate monooxygenase SsuD/methylene tetrahydromethanopterin reductase-like flavin-dependent oxidoreductase (luciferase family)